MRDRLFGKRNMMVVFLILMMGLSTAGCQKADETPERPAKPVLEPIPEEELAGETSGDSASGNGMEKPGSSITKQGEGTVSTGEDLSEYLDGLSEEEIDDLIKESLEEEGYDTKVADGKIRTDNFHVDLPEGFKESEDIPGMYITRRFPIDATNIVYRELDRDLALPMMKKEDLLAMAETYIKTAYGTDAKITVEEYEEVSISRIDSFRILCSYQLEDQTITQLMYVIPADKTYIVIYSMNQDYDRMEMFEESAATIRVTRR